LDPALEADANRLLQQALKRAASERTDWVRVQSAPAAVIEHVLRVLRLSEVTAENAATAPPFEAAPVADLPAPGARLGAWELIRELDAGGMGVVYLARRADQSYDKQVAIKFVRVDPMLPAWMRADLIARFENERRLLARLDHPHIARILDGGRSQAGVPYLVMEFVDGESLTDYCNRAGLDIPARLALFRRVCEAVQAAHRHLIVHRDIKPQNILVDREGEPRLLDFGIARLLAEGGGDEMQTTGMAMTPTYASPEQLRGEPLTTASDVYSLGVVLFELLSGTRPYELAGLSPAESERLVCETTPPTLRRALTQGELLPQEREARTRAVRGDLERLVAQALHKDSRLRYGSAQALADDVGRYLAGMPVLAHPDSLSYRAGKFLRRHRFGSAAAALALVLLLTAASIAAWQWREAARAAQDTMQVNAFLLDMMQVSNPYASGSEITLAQALDEAAALVEQRFSGRPDLAVGIRTTLGESLFARYRLDAAETQLRRALADGERLFGPDDIRTVQALATLASVVKESNRIDDAQALFDDALARLERIGKDGNPLYASVLNDLGVMHLLNENFGNARTYLERALAIAAGDNEERARTVANLAQASRGVGDLDRAEALYREAQPILESIYPDGGPHLAVLLNNRARLAWERDRPEEAIELQKQAVAMHRRSFRGDHVMILVPMTNLARMALDFRDIAVGVEWAEQAVDMADRLYAQAAHPYQVNALAALVEARLAQERVADAVEIAARMQRILADLESVPESTRLFAADTIERVCAVATAPSGLDCEGG
jgi:serine/threonine-protein kinase